ncbi:hypothetical protein K491DRAFT_601250 [Lophiostoma macrostomum CBS 122681]|uniref:Initiator tRNA phosphoribosyl transferase n=1 Tax=Lophiostoma macrostomum CBS 122681 TaxID=1314788 RepID=A0A6A6T3G6_9PLEO|nr:hypothetical protein K491DRAFT_601250 [Lophiostoma macrostomum CBS 122681]
MSHPLTQSDLIFPMQSLSTSTTLNSLRRSALSISNRLSSITRDSVFVQSVAEVFDLPLVANERCGGWYMPPENKVESVYFKSTDGHTNEWSFNTRRLNLQVLDVIEKFGGCVIVDSTRRGKSMPDALLKTVPIWCCVMNRALFAESGSHDLHTPPQAVSASEHAQIEERIDRFVREFLDICKPNIPSLRQKLQKPLRPIWVTQGSTLPEATPDFPEFHPIVLCTASGRVQGAEVSAGGYIQGAADDHEAWSHGLIPKIFWSNKDRLLSTNEEELPELIADLLNKEQGPDSVPALIKPTINLHVSSSQKLDISPYDIIISCTPEALHTTNPEYVKSKKYLHLPLQTGKIGSRDLRGQILRLPSFMESLDLTDSKILVCCPTGKDISVGVALAILCLYANDDGKIKSHATGKHVDKTFIKQRLSWMTTTSPTLNPSRETLKSINAFLMPDPNSRSSAEIPTGPLASRLTLINSNPTSSAPQSHSTPMSHTLFSNLENSNQPWSFTRTLASKLPTHPSGTVTGTATFTPYTFPATAPKSITEAGPALLYSEEGEFVTDTNLRFIARRKYIYILCTPEAEAEADDPYIKIHFFESDAGTEGQGGLFVEMSALALSSDGDAVWKAQNRDTHLCGGDLYAASWKFGDGMVGDVGRVDKKAVEGILGGPGKGEMWWEVRYDVTGPKKDYLSLTRYWRG